MQVKFFGKSAGYFQSAEQVAKALEGEVAAWLAQHPDIKLVSVKQSATGGSLDPSKIWVSIWYEPGTQ